MKRFIEGISTRTLERLAIACGWATIAIGIGTIAYSVYVAATSSLGLGIAGSVFGGVYTVLHAVRHTGFVRDCREHREFERRMAVLRAEVERTLRPIEHRIAEDDSFANVTEARRAGWLQ